MTSLLTAEFRRIPFQLDQMARGYAMRQAMTVWDLGLGKGSFGVALAALALGRGDADLVIIACEKAKLADWESEFSRFTVIPRIAVHHGPGRDKRLAKNGFPQVMISTYETWRHDLAGIEGQKVRGKPLLDELRLRRVMVIYDEVTKLGNRSSNLYKAHQFMLRELRKDDPGMRVYGLTGTPVERDFENAFNEFRLLLGPGIMPTAKEFEDRYVSFRDEYRRPYYRAGHMGPFIELCQRHMLRKRKADPDVINEFPSSTEEFTRLQMSAEQKRLYQIAEDLAWKDGEFRRVPGLQMVLRQMAGHPACLQHADGELAKMLWEELGPALAKCPSAKADELLALARQITSQGSKMLVFTFFGQSVLWELAKVLDEFAIFLHHGGVTAAQNARTREAFLAHDGPAIMLSSDAGARGLNIPVPYIVEYEPARTHAIRQQRFGRGSRLGSNFGQLSCITLTLSGTVEESAMMPALFERGAQTDALLGDGEEQMTTTERRALYAHARKRPA